jgi:hypothetical protein
VPDQEDVIVFQDDAAHPEGGRSRPPEMMVHLGRLSHQPAFCAIESHPDSIDDHLQKPIGPAIANWLVRQSILI